jgi:hypothetical protein
MQHALQHLPLLDTVMMRGRFKTWRPPWCGGHHQDQMAGAVAVVVGIRLFRLTRRRRDGLLSLPAQVMWPLVTPDARALGIVGFGREIGYSL